MSAAATEIAPQATAAHRSSFFRQSGWLMIANVAGGMLMWAVHFLAKKIPEGEYGNFGAFLAVVMVLPTIPLQMVLAQQTARALASNRAHELSGVVRAFWWATTILWLIGAVAVLAFQRPILAAWKIQDPLGLWLTLPVVLLSLWLPMVFGLLQGQQNFLWLGWTMIANAFIRVLVAGVAVLALHAYAGGMMAGVLLGIIVAVAIGAWQTRSLWMTAAAPFEWRGVVHQVIPLVLGFLGFQILFTADTMFVKAWFPEATAGFYVSAGTLSRALMWLVLPLAAVMFPRIVHSAAKSEKTNLMGLVLLGTGILAVVGALSLSVLGPWIVRLVFKQSYVAVASEILPWYAGAMVPLALANVLLNNLLAKPEAQLVPSICILAVALAYMFALTQFHDSLVTVLKVLGISNTVLLAVCAWFTWRVKRAPVQ